MNFTFHHVAIQTSNLETSLHFYHHILGLPLIKEETSPRGRRIVWLKAGLGRIELYSGKPGQPLEDRWNENGIGPVSIGFVVENLKDTLSELKTKGVHILKEPYEPVPGELTAMIEGPDGEEIVLMERPVSD